MKVYSMLASKLCILAMVLNFGLILPGVLMRIERFEDPIGIISYHYVAASSTIIATKMFLIINTAHIQLLMKGN